MSLTYTNASALPVSAFIAVAAVLSLGFLAVWSFVAKDLKEAGGGGDTSGSETKPKQGVGA